MRDDLSGQVSNLRIHQPPNPVSTFSVSVCISSVRGRGLPERRPESCPKGPPAPPQRGVFLHFGASYPSANKSLAFPQRLEAPQDKAPADLVCRVVHAIESWPKRYLHPFDPAMHACAPAQSPTISASMLRGAFLSGCRTNPQEIGLEVIILHGPPSRMICCLD